MKKHTIGNKGFTVMEMLIVVAIIAILIAVAIVTFSSSLEKAKAATCMANCRALKAQLTLEYMLGERNFTEGKGFSLTDSESAEFTCPSGGKITYAFSSGTFTVSCSKHSGAAMPDKVQDILTSIDKIGSANKVGGIVDSTSGSKTVAEFQNAMKEAGIDLEAMGAKSWRYQKDGNGAFLYWTDQDISTVKPGSTVPVIRYNSNSGTYTVWYAKITDSNGYNIISQGNIYPPCGKTPADGQTYDKAVEWLKEAQSS